MAIYWGSGGIIELTRIADGNFRSEMDAGDVNISERRFSFDFPSGTFLTGDRLVLTRVSADGTPSSSPLDFVSPDGWGDNQQHGDGAWYVNVDPLGGLRLYRSWDEALAGLPGNAVSLLAPSSSYSITAELEAGIAHCLGQVSQFSLLTERETVDVSVLGDAFARQWSGMISGRGEITAFWDWRPSTNCGQVTGQQEVAHYFHQLILRQQLGSEFKASLYLKRDGGRPLDEDLSGAPLRTALFYELTGVVTNVGIDFSPGEALSSKIEFVTTGPLLLRYSIPSAAFLLQENSDRIWLEDDSGFIALEADS